MTWVEWIDEVAIPARHARGVDSVGGISPATLARCENGTCPRLAMLRRWAVGLELDVAVAEAAWRSYYDARGLIAVCAALRPGPWHTTKGGACVLSDMRIWQEAGGYSGQVDRQRPVWGLTVAAVLDVLLPVIG
jgi:hypothetical protein